MRTRKTATIIPITEPVDNDGEEWFVVDVVSDVGLDVELVPGSVMSRLEAVGVDEPEAPINKLVPTSTELAVLPPETPAAVGTAVA